MSDNENTDEITIDDGFLTPPIRQLTNEEIQRNNNLRAERTQAIMEARERIRRQGRRRRRRRGVRFVERVPPRVLRLRNLLFGPPSPPGSPNSITNIDENIRLNDLI